MAGSVTDDKFVESFVAQAVTKFGRLDVVVNNAGILRQSTLDSATLMEVRGNVSSSCNRALRTMIWSWL